MNNIKNKFVIYSLLVAFIVLFVAFTVCSFVYVPTASAMTMDVVYTTQSFVNLNYLYQYPIVDSSSIGTYTSTWYLQFEVSSDGDVGFVIYTLDHNYNNTPDEVQLTKRSYDDMSTVESYLMSKTGSTSYRYMDYVLQYEQIADTIVATPSYMTVSYTSLVNSPYNWTVKRYYTTGTTSATYSGAVLCSYTFGNDSYRFTFTFVTRSTIDMATSLDNGTKTYTSTMYFSESLTESNQYQNGYDVGFKDGVNKSNTTINKDSASYLQGVIDGASENNPFTFQSLFGSIADSQLTIIDGLLGFDFLGVNVLSLFKVIITLGLVYGVFRLIKG